MISKELNAALSDEKLREQWLKRLLPALVITVIYFVFISNTLTDKADKAEEAYMALAGKGISEASLPGMEQQNISLRDQLEKLKQQDQAVQANLSAKAGFLAGQHDGNDAIGRIAELMEAHHLQIVEEKSLADKKTADLPPSFAHLHKWLKDMLKQGDGVHVHRIQFIGAYLDTYQALRAMASGDIKALPLFLSMKSQDKPSVEKSWTLDLWL